MFFIKKKSFLIKHIATVDLLILNLDVYTNQHTHKLINFGFGF